MLQTELFPGTEGERAAAVLELIDRRAARCRASDESHKRARDAALDALAEGATGHRALEVGRSRLSWDETRNLLRNFKLSG